jgi:hypothetical protein
MNLQAVYSKTAGGAEEITTRSLHLDAMTRRLLIIVDGERSAEELMQFFKEGQDISVLFETLTQLGLIERTGGPITDTAPDSVQPLPAKPNANVGQPKGPPTTTVISELQTTDMLTPSVTNQAGTKPVPAGSPRAAPHHAGSHRFTQSQTFMQETARKVLGLKGVFFVSKIERAANEGELIALLDQFQSELFDGLKDRNAAKKYREQAEAMLSKL